jgi:hypothetical protein
MSWTELCVLLAHGPGAKGSERLKSQNSINFFYNSPPDINSRLCDRDAKLVSS